MQKYIKITPVMDQILSHHPFRIFIISTGLPADILTLVLEKSNINGYTVLLILDQILQIPGVFSIDFTQVKQELINVFFRKEKLLIVTKPFVRLKRLILSPNCSVIMLSSQFESYNDYMAALKFFGLESTEDSLNHVLRTGYKIFTEPVLFESTLYAINNPEDKLKIIKDFLHKRCLIIAPFERDKLNILKEYLERITTVYLNISDVYPQERENNIELFKRGTGCLLSNLFLDKNTNANVIVNYLNYNTDSLLRNHLFYSAIDAEILLFVDKNSPQDQEKYANLINKFNLLTNNVESIYYTNKSLQL
jgi:hypothetical protein